MLRLQIRQACLWGNSLWLEEILRRVGAFLRMKCGGVLEHIKTNPVILRRSLPKDLLVE